MAVDEALLQSATEGVATLRFYAWNQPTLSLGYFQRCEDRQQHAASCGCPLVRRSSGGGAILHDRELTYSFAVPLQNRTSQFITTLYQTFHQTLIEVLKRWDFQASLCVNAVKLPAACEPFLCFERRSEGDVLAADSKIAGSAQRRRRGAVIQHGSVILNTSQYAPELPGLNDLADRVIAPKELLACWQQQLGDELDLSLYKESLSAEELQTANTLKREKFSQPTWTQRRP